MNMKPKAIHEYLHPAFLSCVLILGLSSVGMSMMIESLGGYLTKEPLLLRAPLDEIDQEALMPFKVVSTLQIKDKETLKSLGTEDYIEWVLEDTADENPGKRLLLFVTYYRLPDRVPHVPEECYMGAGFQRLATDAVRFDVNGAPLDAKYLVFGGTQPQIWQSRLRVPVVYFFRVNGQYAADRNEARMLLNKNLFGRSSYFSKVELVFNQQSDPVTQAEVLERSERLLERLLPVLEASHWPQWGN